MNCHRVQKLLSSYLDQELSAEERREIRRHLFGCSPCSRLCDELTLIKDSLESLEPPAISRDILKKVHLYREGRLLQTTFLWGKRLAMAAAWIFVSPHFFPALSELFGGTAKSKNGAGAHYPCTGSQRGARTFLPSPGIPVSR